RCTEGFSFVMIIPDSCGLKPGMTVCWVCDLWIPDQVRYDEVCGVWLLWLPVQGRYGSGDWVCDLWRPA
ncbi:hypothetical protein, partial [Dasania marina]|uniref:hypothetical protein n=1 Tax=Dasania marina TaxID=471499 RepID=UPI0030D8A100